MVSRAFLIALLAAGLTACTTPAPQSPQPVPQSPRASDTEAAHSVQPGKGLLAQAREARQAGELDRAQNLLQRAQRIDSRNPLVYLEFAQLYADRGDMVESRTMAERGLLYCDRASCRQLKQFTEN
jgi:predicted Zn-dependent protease